MSSRKVLSSQWVSFYILVIFWWPYIDSNAFISSVVCGIITFLCGLIEMFDECLQNRILECYNRILHMYNRSYVPISNITTAGAKQNTLVCRSKSLIFFTVLSPTTCFRSKVLLAWSSNCCSKSQLSCQMKECQGIITFGTHKTICDLLWENGH